jgi:hypothetical protein
MRRMSISEKEAREAWTLAVLAKRCGCSRVSGKRSYGNGGDNPVGDALCDGPIDAHHIISKQYIKLKTYPAAPEAILDILYDPRNGIPLCRKHHQQVDTNYILLHEDQIAPHAFDAISFAYQHGFYQRYEQGVEFCDWDERKKPWLHKK